jgi:hypothetical protein
MMKTGQVVLGETDTADSKASIFMVTSVLTKGGTAFMTVIIYKLLKKKPAYSLSLKNWLTTGLCS